MSDDDLHLEIGHGLCIGIVGYSTLLIEEQKAATSPKSSEVPIHPFRQL